MIVQGKVVAEGGQAPALAGDALVAALSPSIDSRRNQQHSRHTKIFFVLFAYPVCTYRHSYCSYALLAAHVGQPSPSRAEWVTCTLIVFDAVRSRAVSFTVCQRSEKPSVFFLRQARKQSRTARAACAYDSCAQTCIL
jgi:hypothetical protein